MSQTLQRQSKKTKQKKKQSDLVTFSDCHDIHRSKTQYTSVCKISEHKNKIICSKVNYLEMGLFNITFQLLIPVEQSFTSLVLLSTIYIIL